MGGETGILDLSKLYSICDGPYYIWDVGVLRQGIPYQADVYGYYQTGCRHEELCTDSNGNGMMDNCAERPVHCFPSWTERVLPPVPPQINDPTTNIK